jgi:hypothetical protein
MAMFEDEPDEREAERPSDPVTRAREKADEFRMHAELAAVFEGARKFDAQIRSGLSIDIARDIQRTIARLEKSKVPDTPVIDPASAPEAARLLDLPTTGDLSTNDYHIHRRPGETMIVRWLAGELVDTFYERLQAHFDAALNAFRAEERQSLEWKQDPASLQYLEALDALEIKMPDRYLRDPIRQHKVYVLSTQTADEMDILHLSDYLMGVDAAEIVGRASAPPEEPTQQDRAWFFKLFSLRGVKSDLEQMCFFTYLQKAEDTFEL